MTLFKTCSPPALPANAGTRKTWARADLFSSLLIAALVAVGLAACGGGSGEGETTQAATATATDSVRLAAGLTAVDDEDMAGLDEELDEGERVRLAALAEAEEAVGASSDADAESPAATAAYAAALVPGNTVPVANAGTPQSVKAGAVVTLDGRASHDADGTALEYSWVLSSKPNGSEAALLRSKTAQPVFAADLAGSYVATLKVYDGAVHSKAATVTVSVSPTVLPASSVTGTMARASKPTLKADQSGCAAVNLYDIGPGKPYTAFSQVPWSQLKGCDTVRIYPKAGNAPYKEMILLSAGSSATPTAPNKFMRVIGMRDKATGALPIIDGTNATQLETLPGQAPRSLQYHDMNSKDSNGIDKRSLYKLGLVMVSQQLGYSYQGGPAGYVAIENLDIRNAAYNGPFTDGKTGSPSAYGHFTACLFVEAAAHLVVKNNEMHNCGNGFFVNSKNHTLVELSQDILVEGNRIYNNGNPLIAGVTGGFSEHNSYTEARGIIFQYNFFGDMRPGAQGDCLKDRSSGLIVRYNTFASNCGLPLHLMDATGGMALITAEAAYKKTHVYGNLFDHAPAAGKSTNLLRYGGDSGILAQYRQGKLFFYNNTLVVRGDGSGSAYPEVFLFNMQLAKAVADVRNNLFYSMPLTAGKAGKIQAFALGTGTVNMSHNWVSPNAAEFWLGHLTGAKINGFAASLAATNKPQLVNETAHNYRPATASPLINAGEEAAIFHVVTPSRMPGLSGWRPKDGKLDIGAFEY
ncbi:MAG: PKD domain-containing protein [Pseudomonadota bacterium]